MGTSSSSSGPGAGVSFDPPWLNTVDLEVDTPVIENNVENNENESQPDELRTNELAPPRRFAGARLNLGKYASSGDKSSLKKALGNYSRKGMGGASNVATRMRASTAAAGGVFELLQDARSRTDSKIRDWVSSLLSRNPSPYEIADEIINQVISSGGTLEEESCRNSMSQAISDLLEINPDLSVLSMDNDSLWMLMEFFMSNEVFNRISLDIGQLFESGKYAPLEAIIRINEMKDYLKSEISAQVTHLRGKVSSPSGQDVNRILQSALKITFEIFEEDI